MSRRFAFFAVTACACVVACMASNDGGQGVACRDPAVGDNGDGGGEDGGDAGGGADAALGTCHRSESIFVCDVVNARDLAGTPVSNGQSVACGMLFRGPPLARLSTQGCLGFAHRGIRTIIDLRTTSEGDSAPEAACVRDAANIVLAPMPIPYNVSPQDYVADLNTTTAIVEAFRALGDAAAYPIYVHCTWGRDRTGVMTAIILSALGATRTEVMKEYLLSQQTVGAYPDSLNAVLDEIDRRGGIEAFLTAAGISQVQLATLRAQAVAAP